MRFLPVVLLLGSVTLSGSADDSPPAMSPKRTDLKPFTYSPAKVPFYPESATWGKQAEPIGRMQDPLPPEESIKHYIHPVDLEPRLFVSEELLDGKPIALTWDERGRLWVALTMDYPNDLQPAGLGRDRIVICTDTDGDGKADKVTLFADKLSIPTSILRYRDGVIVHQAPQTLFLRDTNGDDVCDVREVLLEGWLTYDTHAGPSNLRYGFDNWIHGMVGYAGFAGKIGGERRSFRTGFYRFRPDGKSLEFLRNTNNNSWGVGFSEDGLHFGSTANGNPSVYLPIPNRYYEAVAGWSSSVLTGIAGDPRFSPVTKEVRQVDFHGRFTAAAGHALYTARTYPKQYWNRTAFVCEPTGHLVATFVIERDGADCRSRVGWNLLAGADEWQAPIVAEVGPDGNVWVIDWYNFIVQHNPTPQGFANGKGNAYETPLRDKKHGRIYRLVAKNAPLAKQPNLHNADAKTLVAHLAHDNMFWRLTAQRLLVERGQTDVVPDLLKLVAGEQVDEIGLNPGSIHALWTLHGLGAMNTADAAVDGAVFAALKQASAGTRRAALAVLPRNSAGTQALIAARVLHDPDAQVLLQALLTAAELPTDPTLADALVVCSRDPRFASDRWLRDGLTAAAAKQAVGWLRGLMRAEADIPNAIHPIVEIVARHLAIQGSPDELGELIATMAKAKAERVAPIASAWAAGLRKGQKLLLPQAAIRTLCDLLDTSTGKAQIDLLRLALATGDAQVTARLDTLLPSLVQRTREDKEPENVRLDAVRQLIAIRADDTTAKLLLDLIGPRTSPSFAQGLLEALESSDIASLGDLLVGRWATLSPAQKALALRALFARTDRLPALVTALEKGTIPLGDLSLSQRQALTNLTNAELAARAEALLARGGGLPNPDREKVIREYASVVLKEPGSPERGKPLFAKHCAVCHMLDNDGGKIGPDLTGMAVHPREEILVHILDPNRSVEGNFRAYNVETTDGRLLTGLLASETKTSIELIDATARKFVLQRDEIEEIRATTNSLMPEGFEKQLSPQDMTDLMAYLTKKGRFIPLSLAKVATASSARGLFYDPAARGEMFLLHEWGTRTAQGVPFTLLDPQGGRIANVVMLHSVSGPLPQSLPRFVSLPCRTAAKKIHFLGGVAGWAYPGGRTGSISAVVRLRYADGATEDHPLRNGLEIADYVRKIEVPNSTFAFLTDNGRQLRVISVTPKENKVIESIELRKGTDATAPLFFAVTIETPG